MLLHRSVLKREKPVACTAIRHDIELFEWYSIERKKDKHWTCIVFQHGIVLYILLKEEGETLNLPLDMISNQDKHDKRIENREYQTMTSMTRE